ncbi:MAG: hypothetical protein R3C14_26285 [Caldilineaceae bacterium]
MLIGTAWEEITPDRPLPLLGQMHVRLGEYTHDPLTVNAVLFTEGEQQVALLSVDVCVLPDALVRTLQAACARATGIAAEAVIIAATHTHVAPCTTDRIVGDPDPAFLARLEEAVVQAVSRALADREPCDLFAGRGYLEQMGWNRRGMRRDGSCHMYWGSWKEDFVGIEGPRDGEVGVIFARKPDGQVKMVIPSFATHPNCVEGESYYSADLPGQVRRVLRGALGEQVGVVYLTGAAGNTAPSIMENNPQAIQPWRGETGLRRSGDYLGGEILKVIAGQVDPMPTPVLRHAQTALAIPMREWDAWADLAEFKGGMLEFFEQSRMDWPRLLQEENPVAVRLHVVRVGDAAICLNPAELYVEFGLAIKRQSPAQVTLVGELSDGYCGYVPTPEAIRHGGYSALSASHTRLVPEAGWLMIETTGQLLGQLFGR